jgi:hypothetical protein
VLAASQRGVCASFRFARLPVLVKAQAWQSGSAARLCFAVLVLRKVLACCHVLCSSTCHAVYAGKKRAASRRFQRPRRYARKACTFARFAAVPLQKCAFCRKALPLGVALAACWRRA